MKYSVNTYLFKVLQTSTVLRKCTHTPADETMCAAVYSNNAPWSQKF